MNNMLNLKNEKKNVRKLTTEDMLSKKLEEL